MGGTEEARREGEARSDGSVSITAEMLSEARKFGLNQGRSWLAVLAERMSRPRKEFVGALSRATHFPYVDSVALMDLAPVFDSLSFAECMRRECLVVRMPEDCLALVFADPFRKENLRWARENLPKSSRRFLADRDDIAAYLARQEEHLRAIDSSLAGNDIALINDEGIETISLERISEDDNPVVKLVSSILYDALKLKASDIHLKCSVSGMVIKYRLDGILSPVGAASGRDNAEQVISRIKVLADLDIAERRIPQDGRFKVRVKDAEVDFRVSIMPGIFGEDAVLRLLDRRSLAGEGKVLRLTDLGLDESAIAIFRRLTRHPYGMILVTGPTGSGKTTTLYAAINEVNTGRDNIVTIEDPVEYQLPDVLQIPVNEKKGLTFARGLRSILRHDPDKIMVGEIRDEETARIAVQAALTGHLVFTTVHANNVFDVLGRFLHMGVDAYSFTSALIGIWAQRLVRVNCPECSDVFIPDAALLSESGLLAEDPEKFRFRKGAGCGYCRGTGYKGRKAVAEFLILNDCLREMIVSRRSVVDLKEEARKTGATTLRESALKLVAAGETTLEEINRVTFAL
ncbi:MAG: GspE/PulE family protein [Candidatus Accumulibacter sp.]|jgi:general secretion pathway protein E|nr:GspE/PulE family protein [Accumulibacter sp.]